MSDSLLPPGFEALEPFVGAWAVAGAANRAQRRNDSTEAERLPFYEAASKAAPEALAYLDRTPLHAFDEREERLMNMMLTLAHISLAVEAQGSDEPRHAKDRAHLRITRAPSDLHA